MAQQELIEKLKSGKEISLVDIIEANAESQLRQLREEAERQVADEEERERAQSREKRAFENLVSLAQEIRNLEDEYEENQNHRKQAQIPFAERELELREKLIKRNQALGTAYHQLNGSPYLTHRRNSPLAKRLAKAGVDLRVLEFSYIRLSLSREAEEILKGRRNR